MDKTNPDSRALRKMLEALIPTECTLAEFGQIFSDYIVNYEEYAYDKKHHAIIVQIPSLPGLEFQFKCDPTTHTSQTHNNHFELIAITSDYPLLFPEYENLSVENLKENGEDISIEQGSLLIQIIIEKEFSYYNICDEIPTEGTPITPRGKVVLTPFYYPQKG